MLRKPLFLAGLLILLTIIGCSVLVYGDQRPDQYDADGNGLISYTEVTAATQAYVRGHLTQEKALDYLLRYHSGIASLTPIPALTPGPTATPTPTPTWVPTPTATLFPTLTPVLVQPDRPTIASVTTEVDAYGFSITWAPPERDGNTAIIGYDLRYRVNGGAWITLLNVAKGWHTHLGIPTTARGSPSYQVQMRAVNSVDAGFWSATARSVLLRSPPTPTPTPTPGLVCLGRAGAIARSADYAALKYGRSGGQHSWYIGRQLLNQTVEWEVTFINPAVAEWSYGFRAIFDSGTKIDFIAEDDGSWTITRKKSMDSQAEAIDAGSFPEALDFKIGAGERNTLILDVGKGGSENMPIRIEVNGQLYLTIALPFAKYHLGHGSSERHAYYIIASPEGVEYEGLRNEWCRDQNK